MGLMRTYRLKPEVDGCPLSVQDGLTFCLDKECRLRKGGLCSVPLASLETRSKPSSSRGLHGGNREDQLEEGLKENG